MKLNAIALALGLASSSAFAGVVIQIDPDGSYGTDAAQAVTSLGWNNGNSISTPTANGQVVPSPTGIIQTYGHSSLANFNGTDSNPIGGLGLNSAYEWTYVFGSLESATTVPVIPNVLNTSFFTSVAGGDNFFRVFYSAVNASNVNGTGFNDGVLIMEGTIAPYNAADGTGFGTFTGSTAAPGVLDQNGTDNYAAYNLTTTIGTGGTKLAGILTYVNSDFIKGSIESIVIALDTQNSQPFKQTDPSSCFTAGNGDPVDGAGPNDQGGLCANGIGTQNGNDGPNVMFMTRATSDFRVPEPGSLALVGAGVLSALGLRRKRT